MAHTKKDDPWAVSRPAENKLIYKLSLVGEFKCRELFKAYNDCMSNSGVAGMALCRTQYKQSNDCLAKYVNERNKALMKRRWIEAGRPRYPDWRAMMSDLIGGEAAFDEAMADVRRQQEERLRQSQTAAQQAS